MKIICFKAKRFLSGLGLLALAVAVLFVMREVGMYAVNAVSAARSLPIYSVEREEKKIAISFDCAWGTDHTDAILRELERARRTVHLFYGAVLDGKVSRIRQKNRRSGTRRSASHSKTHPT